MVGSSRAAAACQAEDLGLLRPLRSTITLQFALIYYAISSGCSSMCMRANSGKPQYLKLTSYSGT